MTWAGERRRLRKMTAGGHAARGSAAVLNNTHTSSTQQQNHCDNWEHGVCYYRAAQDATCDLDHIPSMLFPLGDSHTQHKTNSDIHLQNLRSVKNTKPDTFCGLFLTLTAALVKRFALCLRRSDLIKPAEEETENGYVEFEWGNNVTPALERQRRIEYYLCSTLMLWINIKCTWGSKGD